MASNQRKVAKETIKKIKLINKGNAYKSEEAGGNGNGNSNKLYNVDRVIALQQNIKHKNKINKKLQEMFFNKRVQVYFMTNEGLHYYKGIIDYHRGATRINGFRTWKIKFDDNTVDNIYLGSENYNKKELYGWTYIDDKLNKKFSKYYLNKIKKVKKPKEVVIPYNTNSSSISNDNIIEYQSPNSITYKPIPPKKKAAAAASIVKDKQTIELSKSNVGSKSENLSLIPCNKESNTNVRPKISKKRTSKSEVKYIRHINYLMVEINDLHTKLNKLHDENNYLRKNNKHR